MKKIFALVICLLLIAVPCFAFAVDMPNAEYYRVVDTQGIFTDKQIADLDERICNLVNKHELDLVIYICDTSNGGKNEKIAEDFYDFNGYGIGNDGSGSVLLINFNSSQRGWWTSACGKAEKYYTYDSINIIDDSIENDMVNGDYYNAMLTYIDKVDELYTKGVASFTNNSSSGNVPQKVEKSFIQKLATASPIALIIGLISGGAAQGAAKKSMMTIASAKDADKNFVPGSLQLYRNEDIYLGSSVSRMAKPTVSASSGSHSSSHSGRSSYSSSHRSSSGRSHSGGGRRF